MTLSVIVISLCDASSNFSKNIHIDRKKVIILKASTPSDISAIGLRGQMELSQVESAISLSHKRARDLALVLDSDWALILEEDAIQHVTESEISNFLTELDDALGNSSAKAVHFAPEQFGILRASNFDGFYSTIVLADCAVAYALNRQALRDISHTTFSFNEVADWPKNLRSLDWYSPKCAFFGHPDLIDPNVKSSTLKDRSLRVKQKTFWKLVVEKRTYKTILFLFLSRLGRPYGSGYVANNRFRSTVIKFCLK
jgi:hypothetical protein